MTTVLFSGLVCLWANRRVEITVVALRGSIVYLLFYDLDIIYYIM